MTTNHLEPYAVRRVPKMIVFDLDYTLWPFLIEARANPTSYETNAGKVVDYRGHVVKHYPAAPKIFEFLSENNIGVSVASRNAAMEGAEKLVRLFGWSKYFQSVQIYPGKKTKHVLRISESCNVELEDMLFFDDERRNIDDLESLGVVSVLVTNGMTMQVLLDGLKKFSDARPSNSRQ